MKINLHVDITSDDYYIKYHYTPFSELIDFNVTASTSRGNQKYRDGSLYTFYKTSAQNRSDALDIALIPAGSLSRTMTRVYAGQQTDACPL